MPKLINTGRSFRITLNRLVDEKLKQVCVIKKWNDRELLELLIIEGIQRLEKEIIESASGHHPKISLNDIAEMDTGKRDKIIKDDKKR